MAEGAPDYFKRAMLYGLYEGAAVPLACDEQGRLIFVTEEVSPFDKSGTTIVYDDFTEGLIHCQTGGDGTGNAVAVDSTEAFVGAFSCKLTGGSDGAAYAEVLYYVHPTTFNKIGLQWYARRYVKTQYVEARITVYTGSRLLIGKVRFERTNQRWAVYDYDAAAWVDILSPEVPIYNANEFAPYKLIVDCAAETYVSFRHSGGLVDLSAYSLSAADSSQFVRAAMEIFCWPDPGENGMLNIDNIRITQDES